MTPTNHRDVAGLTNWGRWGEDDERGCLNYITEDVRAAAAAEGRTGLTVSLARPVPLVPLAGGPFATGNAPAPAAVSAAMTVTSLPPRALTDLLVINTHNGTLTHLDALGHIPVDGQIYPGRPVGDVLADGRLGHASTTAFADGVLTRGVLADLAPGSALSPGHPVTGTDLDAALDRAGVDVAPGDALVIRSGWNPAAVGTQPMPGMTVDAVGWMHDHRISLYLGDVGDAHPPLDHDHPLPLHRIGLARLGLPLVDAAAVDKLAATCASLGRYRFQLVIAAIPIEGATGVPINPLAVF